ncbi:MAG: 6-oxocyclohex-1-ene-1-carbonyl-CoA hydratase [Deltaproteobacteria bacterium]|nr:6-oxocyclohex-1-ene-1-carbonyl-CoA hydratase [Candidatus Anaeroferrophillus wilburensis]MBN2888878.1 6-oxocyclohex-1-ene-1-carbonyl-CoA hydratase [Deltaproteobacteria bacterium]
MALEWIPREHGKKDHGMWLDAHFGSESEAPCTIYEKRPVLDPQGKVIDGLYTGWIILNNPNQYNSYTTDMVKGVIAGFQRASADPSVVAAIFTAVGDKAFCTGGNTKEYAEYYSKRPQEYGDYMDLFNGMVDAILNCKKPTICRINGMRVAGGQEIGMATDLSVASDLAILGQAGPKHGSAPDGGSTDFLPWYLGIEDAMWNCVSCEMWSAYKMKRLGLLTKVVPVIKEGDQWVRNPLVITDSWVQDGEIAYGEFKTGAAAKEARAYVKEAQIDLSLLDEAVDEIVWKFANLMPHCLMKSVDGIRAKKKFFWDQMKLPNRHWLAANMNYEAFMGFNAFNTKKITGQDTIDFIRYRQLVAEGEELGEKLYTQVFGTPQE